MRSPGMASRRTTRALLVALLALGLGACGQGEDNIGERVDNPNPSQVTPADDDGSGTPGGGQGDPSSGDDGSGSSIPGGNTSGGGGGGNTP